MISTTMATALNEQIKWEMYSANLYLAMSAYLQDAGLTGFSHWMRIQYQEETAHALKFYDFLLSRGGQVTMLSIDAPDANWSNILEIFEETLSHEQEVTRRTSKDHISKLRMIKGEGQGMLVLDKDMSARTFTPPPAN